ncbi:MAG: flavin reductase family protein [Tistlia sp.]|uniref:flavin reductase family protein n=1 Tax=Tistlia sp. TaxID=3057121 RepID=UPI0034A27F99
MPPCAEAARTAFLAAMAQAATAVSVVATEGPAGRRGTTVSALSSVSAEPPLLLVCLHHLSPTCAAIETNRSFTVNLLAEHQSAISDVFAGRGLGAGQDKFATGGWRRGDDGALRLEGAAATFHCALEAAHAHGTHRIFVGRVLESAPGAERPLLYQARGYRRLAPCAPASV